MSYAVTWQNGDGRRYAGRLDLDRDALRLEGSDVVEDLPYAHLAEVRIARGPDERLSGAPTLVVRERGGRAMCTPCIGGAGGPPPPLGGGRPFRADPPPPPP